MSKSHLFPFDFPGVPYRKWLDPSHQIEAATRQIIVEKRANGVDADSLLSRLIQATDEDGMAFSEEDLVGHISPMVWGSRDAAAAAVLWTLFLNSLHPEIQPGIVGELDAVLHGSPPSEEQLAQLSLTENALEKNLRLLHPFPLVNRVASPSRKLGRYEVPEARK